MFKIWNLNFTKGNLPDNLLKSYIYKFGVSHTDLTAIEFADIFLMYPSMITEFQQVAFPSILFISRIVTHSVSWFIAVWTRS